MNKPILSREEVLGFASDAFNIDYDRLDARFEKYAAIIEAAIMEKVCAEPVKWQAKTINGIWFDVKSDIVDRMRDEGTEVRALYAINRSKS
jgi:hypothetical protein